MAQFWFVAVGLLVGVALFGRPRRLESTTAGEVTAASGSQVRIVVPARNEAASLANLLDDLAIGRPDGADVVVVDDRETIARADALGARPGGVFRRGQDGPERDREAHRAAVARGLGLHAGGQLLHLVQRFAPQRIHVGMLAGHRQRRFAGAAEVDGHMRLLQRLDFGEAGLEAVVLALVVEGLVAGPQPAQQRQVFVGALVALVVVQVVAIAALLGIRPAGDEVHAQPATAELVERGDLPRRQRGHREARPVRQHEMHALGVRCCIADGERGAGPRGVVRHQDAVEACGLMRLRKCLDVVAVDRRAAGGMDLRDLLALDHADEFDAHACSLTTAEGLPDGRGRCGTLRAPVPRSNEANRSCLCVLLVSLAAPRRLGCKPRMKEPAR